ncbi:MAG: hypothetical protein ACE5FG_00115 [Myxococcota bacterium]
MFGRRPDGTLVRDLPPIRRFMPFISPGRNDSAVYLSQEIDVEPALELVEAWNRERPDGPKLTFFHLVLRAIARVLDERPRLNRFVAGGRVWQRRGIWLTFSAKKRLEESAPIVTVKLELDPRAPLDEMLARIHGALEDRRSDRPDTSDREVAWLLRLPPLLVRLALAAARAFDALGLLPAAMIRSDPMFASAFIANLGSVGLDAGYHHLWEYGTIPIFCVVGRIREGADGRRRALLKYSFDERIEDGLYCARSLERLRQLLEKPTELVG